MMMEKKKKSLKKIMPEITEKPPKLDVHAYALSIIAVILLIVLVINLANIFAISKKLEPKEAIELQVTLLADVNCKDCTDLSPLITALEKYGKVESVKLDKSSQEAKDLISRYGIEALPNIIITGNFDEEPKIKADLAVLGAVEKEDAIVLTQIPPPFYDLKSGKIRGFVDVTILRDSSCTLCFDLKDSITQLQQVMKIASQKTVDISSAEGKALISKYKITKIPALILSADASLYPAIGQAWESLGTVESDGSLVMREAAPPYKDLSTNTVKGAVTLTMLTDKSCSSCYNATVHKQALAAIGLSKFEEEKAVDISSAEGKALVDKYKITAVPTIIISGDVDVYTSLKQIWPSVGTVDDGAYVFRNMQAIQGAVYKDLQNNTVVGG